MQASVFEISIFPLVLQIPVSRRIHIGGECVHVYAQNIESDLLAEGVSGNGEEGGGGRGTYELRVTGAPLDSILFRDSTHSFHSAHPLGARETSIPPFASRHWRPDIHSPRSPLAPIFLLPRSLFSPRFRAILYSPIPIFSFSLSTLARTTLWFLSSGRRSNTLSRAFPRPSSVLFPLRHPLRDSHESLVRISSVVDTSQYCLKNRMYTLADTRRCIDRCASMTTLDFCEIHTFSKFNL